MAYDGTRPRNDDFVKDSAGLIRENFEGLRAGGLVLPKPTLFGWGWPAETLGVSFDRYINQKTGDIFYKSYGGQWIRVLNLGSIYRTTAGIYIYGTRAELTGGIGEVGDLGIINDKMVQHFYIKESSGWVWKAKVPNGSEQYQDMGSLSGTKNINAANGTIVKFTVSSALTITLTANIDGGMGCTLTLLMRKGGAYKVTWPTSVAWAGGATPTFSATQTDVVTLTTINGSDWIGTVAGATAEEEKEIQYAIAIFTSSGSIKAPTWATKALISGCAGGGGGGGSGGGAGSSGGATSFGALLTLTGGGGGETTQNMGVGTGGAKGIGTAGLVPATGAVGSVSTGAGGSNPFGDGGDSFTTTGTAGKAGKGYGSGGSGGSAGSSTGYKGSGGGSGGACLMSRVAVESGKTYTITIGAGGSGGTGVYAGGAGAPGFLIIEWVA